MEGLKLFRRVRVLFDVGIEYGTEGFKSVVDKTSSLCCLHQYRLGNILIGVWEGFLDERSSHTFQFLLSDEVLMRFLNECDSWHIQSDFLCFCCHIIVYLIVSSWLIQLA